MGSGLLWATTAALAVAVSAAPATAQVQTPTRTPLRVIPINPSKTVNRIETTRVDFAPGQIMPRHKHTVPVVCFVMRGDFLVKIGDAPEARAPEGSVTYEPPGIVIGYFRNASSSAPAQLGCALLASDTDTVLNVPLP
jgi:quercetin dioxygenase-like cupin family protein